MKMLFLLHHGLLGSLSAHPASWGRTMSPGMNALPTRARGLTAAMSAPRFIDALTTVESYEYDGFTCAYRHKRACAGYEEWAPLLLVHPVGIGLDSWFWHPFLRLWPGEAFAPDLIGCGRSDAWDPAERGLFIPLEWVRGLEALWRMHVRRPVILVSQGGLAPVALCLAARENDRRARDV